MSGLHFLHAMERQAYEEAVQEGFGAIVVLYAMEYEDGTTDDLPAELYALRDKLALHLGIDVDLPGDDLDTDESV